MIDYTPSIFQKHIVTIRFLTFLADRICADFGHLWTVSHWCSLLYALQKVWLAFISINIKQGILSTWNEKLKVQSTVWECSGQNNPNVISIRHQLLIYHIWQMSLGETSMIFLSIWIFSSESWPCRLGI